MPKHPQVLSRLIENLSRLPGVGAKSATRMALYLMRAPEERARELAGSIVEVKEKIRFCSTCFNYTDDDPCTICRDRRRGQTGILCLVEGPADIMALENTGVFEGLYHVLGGVLAPLAGIGPEELRVAELKARVRAGGFTEVLLALPSSVEGEATSRYLSDMLKKEGLKVTRIAQGVPLGAELEYVDQATLKRAVNDRRET